VLIIISASAVVRATINAAVSGLPDRPDGYEPRRCPSASGVSSLSL